MLVAFTQIDYDYDMALVAFDRIQSEERMLGVARIMSKPGGVTPEFAVIVGDPWQGKGIGSTLMKNLLAIAEDRGIEKIWGVVLAENTHMLAMARKLGCEISRGQSASEYEVKIDLNALKID